MIELNGLRIKTLLMALAFTLLVNARAELPPSVYEEMKRNSDEVVVVQILKSSSADLKLAGNRVQLTYEAKVLRIIRSKSHLRPSTAITIQSSYYRFGPGEVGPSNPRRLKKSDVVTAYLHKGKKVGQYIIAAGGHSFEKTMTGAEDKRFDENKAFKPVKTYRGMIHFPRLFSLDGSKTKEVSPLIVVQDERQYEAFVARIPTKQISKTRPALPSSDPLLKKPEIDFTKYTLLAVSRLSMSRPIIKSVRTDQNKVHVGVEYPKEFPAARPLNIGTYIAVLIPKTKGEYTVSPVKSQSIPPTFIGGKTPREVLIEFKFQGFLALNDQHWKSYRWVFDRLDTDGDGRHSKQEYIVNGVHMNEQARKGIFNAADYDQDGFVTAFEYFENRIITDEAKLIFEAMDQNKNGQLTQTEFMRSKRIKDLKLAEAIFQALDTNNNGELIIPEYLRVWGKWARSK